MIVYSIFRSKACPSAGIAPGSAGISSGWRDLIIIPDKQGRLRADRLKYGHDRRLATPCYRDGGDKNYVDNPSAVLDEGEKLLTQEKHTFEVNAVEAPLTRYARSAERHRPIGPLKFSFYGSIAAQHMRWPS